jgi:hypothetical protein
MPSYTQVKGSQCWLESARGADKAISNIANALPAVVTATAHGLVDGEAAVVFVEAWNAFNNIVVQASEKTDDTFKVAGYDTSDTSRFPASGDTGTLNEITFGTRIGQILECTPEGGELKSETIDPWDEEREIEFFTGETATKVRAVLGFNHESAAQQALLAASRTRAPKAFKFVMGGANVYGYGRVWASEMPQFGPTVLRRNIAFSFLGPATTFTAA